MNTEEIESKISEDTIFLEPRNCFDDAIIDVKNNRIIYDYEKLIECHMIFHDLTYGESVDKITYEVLKSIPQRNKFKPIIDELDDDEDSDSFSDEE